MVMFLRREFIDIALCVKGPGFLRFLQRPQHVLRLRAGLHAKIDARILSGIQQVVAFILGICHTEGPVDILRQRVYLQAEILSAHRIQEVKPDREFRTEAGVVLRAEQFLRAVQGQIHCRNLDIRIVEPQIQRVLFRNAVKRPCIILCGRIEIAVFLHPLAAPDTRVKIRHKTERLVHRLFQSIAELIAGDHLRIIRLVRINQIIDGIEDPDLKQIRHPPFHKVTALEFAQNIIIGIRAVIVAHSCTVAHLNLPACHIKEHAEVPCPKERRTHAVYEDQPGRIFKRLLCGLYFFVIEECLHGAAVHMAEDTVIGQPWHHLLRHFRIRKIQILCFNDERRIQLFQLGKDFLVPHTRIGFRNQHKACIRCDPVLQF